ncbi:hypothetical protein CAPTEDRAFT_223732 [Capitella teleta]|uniref:C2H2-type domain-containing protein n=1 Tax=Capitella teleta TaxID=283909 RepID=R7T851_CAPTE|nr:hypothetical protein CAPTEDRAFT_223732 [Capitella teleta]|eukprot:ELT89849.1 hypothetical protein CAPTEDRAFT_223732 [Capitella teleta]
MQSPHEHSDDNGLSMSLDESSVQKSAEGEDVEMASSGDPVLQVIKAEGDTSDEDDMLNAGMTLVSQPSDEHTLLQVMGGDRNLVDAGEGSVLEATLAGEGDASSIATVTLPDGTMAFIQESTLQDGIAKFVEGETVQLEDGTTAFIQPSNAEGYKTIQLSNGITALVTVQNFASLSEGSVVDKVPAALSSESTSVDQVSLGACGDDQTDFAVASLALASSLSPTISVSAPVAEVVQNKTKDSKINQPSLLQSTLASPSSKSQAEKTTSLTEKAFRCTSENCGRLYTTMHHLRVHERSHTGDRPYKCEYAGCNKAFATNYGLKGHIRVHTGEKPYECPDVNCSKAFKTSGDLQKHIRTHTGEKPFKCPFEGCDRYFTTSNIRKVHIRTHTGLRPYVCPENGCNKAFSSATNYKNHVRIHTGEKPYVCTVQGCGKRFTEYSSLYKHHVVHTHQKPYVCNRCGKTYRQTSTLSMHKRMAHGEDGMTPETNVIADVSKASSFIQPGAMMSGTSTATISLNKTDSGPDESENNLIINTSEADSHVVSMPSAIHMMPQQLTTNLMTTGGIAVTPLCADLGGDGQQQIFVVADPSQLGLLQQLAAQQQQQQQQQQQAEGEENGMESKDAPLQDLLANNVITSEELIQATSSQDQSGFVTVEELNNLTSQ